MRRRKRRVAARFYVIVAVAILLLVYGGSKVFERFVQRTAVISSGNMATKYNADAVIMRDERVTDEEGLVRITYHAEEGTIVFRGNKIAEVVTAGYSQSDMNMLMTTRTNINSYHKHLIASTHTDSQLDSLGAQILERAHELELMVQGKAKGNLINLNRQLQSALDERQKYLRTTHATDQTLSDYYDTESSIQKKIDSWTRHCFADSDCIVSFYTDGYESMLSADKFTTITAAEVRSIINGDAPAMSTAQRGRTPIYREVSPSGWYLLLISHDNSWNPIEGDMYRVRLTGYDDLVVDGVVHSYSRQGNELLVRMTVSGDVRPVLNVRTLQAEVGDRSVTGLWVPREALLIQSGMPGVVLADSGYFVPVSVINQDDMYVVIESVSPGILAEGQKVRLF